MDTHRRIVLAQQRVEADPGSNLEIIRHAVGRASEESPDLIVFPEYALSGTPGSLPSGSTALHARAIDAGLQELVRLSHSTGMALIVPTLHYTGQWRNSAFVISPGAGIVHRYDKCVLTPQERALLAAGTSVRTFPLLDTTAGMLLCSDGNGPELFSLLSFAGARIIFHLSYPDTHPGIWPDPANDPWQVDIGALFPLRGRIRAFSMQVHIIAVVPAGCGSVSRIIDPWGRQIAAACSQGPELVVADIDPETSAFRGSPVFEQRRRVFLQSLAEIDDNAGPL